MGCRVDSMSSLMGQLVTIGSDMVADRVIGVTKRSVGHCVIHGWVVNRPVYHRRVMRLVADGQV